jgi:hypothetical protein
VLFTSFEPQPNPQKEGKCQLQGEMAEKFQLQGEREEMCQLQGERLDRQPPPQPACALNKPPLTRTKESAIPIISVFLIFFS